MVNLLSIKLHRPAPLPRRVQRPALLRQFNEGLQSGRPMTLVSAPAGFGKTTCVSEWLENLSLPAAWYTLDSDDNDPGRFFSYLAAALKKIGETQSSETFRHMTEVESVLRAGQLPPMEVIADAMIADICEYPGHFLLVLDDFHCIQDCFILKVFEKLLSNLFQSNLPQALHLVLLTREDPALPLARLRANNRLTEIRASDLRFTTDETDCFLNEVMELCLSHPEVVLLEDRTEGWVVGLQLAGLSVRGRIDPSRFIQGLSGNQRFILSYLTEEVLSRQTETVQQFLLDTSILNRLNGDLCNAVSRRADSHRLLEQLWSANLFLIPLDDEQVWYRYHNLFGDLLRTRQAHNQGDRTAELHRRASQWFAEAQPHSPLAERPALIREAVQHALEAKDYAAAVQLIENHALDLLLQWYAKTVNGWMLALPPEWSQQSPRINLTFAWMHLMQADFAQAVPYIERLTVMFSGAQSREGAEQTGRFALTPTLNAEWLALQSTLSIAQGKPVEALELAKQALADAPETDSNTQCQAYLGLAVAYQQLGDIGNAVETYQKLIQLGRASDHLITELLGISALALLVIERGQLRYGFELASQGAERIEQSGALPPIGAAIYGELGQIYYHWVQFDQAERYFQRSAQVSSLGSFSDAVIFQSLFRSRLCQLSGDVSGAAVEVQKAVDLMRVDAPAVVQEEVIAQQIRVLLGQNNGAAARQILSSTTVHIQDGSALPDLPLDQSFPYTQAIVYNCALRILLHQGRVNRELTGPPPPDLLVGIDLAGRLLAAFRHSQYVPMELETLLLRAQLFVELGDWPAGLADFSAALDLAEPEGYVSQFIEEGRSVAGALTELLKRSAPGSTRADFIRRILDAFPATPVLKQAESTGPVIVERSVELFEALTGRELEVLRLVAQGQTYAEIAACLVVSINTIRTHVKSIYGKLGVNNRTGAIDAARQMKIL